MHATVDSRNPRAVAVHLDRRRAARAVCRRARRRHLALAPGPPDRPADGLAAQSGRALDERRRRVRAQRDGSLERQEERHKRRGEAAVFGLSQRRARLRPRVATGTRHRPREATRGGAEPACGKYKYKFRTTLVGWIQQNNHGFGRSENYSAPRETRRSRAPNLKTTTLFSLLFVFALRRPGRKDGARLSARGRPRPARARRAARSCNFAVEARRRSARLRSTLGCEPVSSRRTWSSSSRTRSCSTPRWAGR